jgi:hypothetical protein
LFVISDAGTVEVRVPGYPTVASLRGRATTIPKELSYDEMKEIAYEDRLRKRRLYVAAGLALRSSG